MGSFPCLFRLPDHNAKSVSVMPFRRVLGDFDAGGLQVFQVVAFSIKPRTAAEDFFVAPFRGVAAQVAKAQAVGSKLISVNRSGAWKIVQMVGKYGPGFGPVRIQDFPSGIVAHDLAGIRTPRKTLIAGQLKPFVGFGEPVALII